MIKKFQTTISYSRLRRTIHLYLPDDYGSSEERYPVIYMYDGHNLFFDKDATYGKSWGLKEFLDAYPRKFIVVGVECNHEGHKRLDEYSPYSFRLLGMNIHGEGKEYMDWLVHHLKPYIDQKYRTLPDREHTMIAGSSMGGLMSYYSIFAHNDIFSKAACLSSTFDACQEEIRALTLQSNIDPNTRIFLSFGSKELRGRWIKRNPLIQSFHQELKDIIEKKGGQAIFEWVEGASHNEASWEKQIPDFMGYLWK